MQDVTLPKQWSWIFSGERKNVATIETPSGPVFAGMVRVDSTLASRLLGLNTHNRNPSSHKVAQLRGAMERNEWRISPQGISISATNVLLDGQTRLMAVPEDSPAWMLITIGWPDSIQGALDRGRPRSDQDIVQLSTGLSVSTNIMAACRVAVIGGTCSSGRQWTSDQVLTVYNLFGERAGQLLSPAKGLLRNGPIIGACIRASYHIDMARLLEFVSLGDALTAEEKDTAPLRLVRFMSERPHMRQGGQTARALLVRYANSAIVAFAERRPVASIREMKNDPYPLPLEVAEELRRVDISY